MTLSPLEDVARRLRQGVLDDVCRPEGGHDDPSKYRGHAHGIMISAARQ